MKPRIRVKAYSFPLVASSGNVPAANPPCCPPVGTTIPPELGAAGFDLSIPEFLLRDADNVPAYLRGIS